MFEWSISGRSGWASALIQNIYLLVWDFTFCNITCLIYTWTTCNTPKMQENMKSRHTTPLINIQVFSKLLNSNVNWIFTLLCFITCTQYNKVLEQSEKVNAVTTLITVFQWGIMVNCVPKMHLIITQAQNHTCKCQCTWSSLLSGNLCSGLVAKEYKSRWRILGDRFLQCPQQCFFQSVPVRPRTEEDF